jgi:hypothetical protein
MGECGVHRWRAYGHTGFILDRIWNTYIQVEHEGVRFFLSFIRLAPGKFGGKKNPWVLVWDLQPDLVPPFGRRYAHALTRDRAQQVDDVSTRFSAYFKGAQTRQSFARTEIHSRVVDMLVGMIGDS